MTVYTLQVNGTRGELTPLIHARVDTEFYQSGYAQQHNMLVSRYGPAVRTPGTLFYGEAKHADRKAVMRPFVFSSQQLYMLEFGHQYVRFWTPEGQVVSGGAPYEVATGFAEADLRNLRTLQSGDAIYLFCKGHRPQVLRRMAETNWTLVDFKPEDGPYLPVNATDTRLTPSDYGTITPRMTGVSAPYGEVTSNPTDAGRWHVFDKSADTYSHLTGTSGSFTYALPVGVERVVDKYAVTATTQQPQYVDHTPSSWALFGSHDGLTWITIDRRVSENGWAPGETRYYETPNRTAYRYHRFEFYAVDGSTTNSRVGELALTWAAADQDPIRFTASSTVGINNGAGFLASDVGRALRVLGSDGLWRWLEIVAVDSATAIDVLLHGHALPDLTPINVWQLGAWSDETGWPYTGTFFQDRLTLAGSDTDPLGVWMSVPGDYDSFRLSTPGVDDDGLTLRLTGGALNAAFWVVEARDLVLGTSGSLRAVGAGGEVVTPTNVRQRSETKVRAGEIEPIEIENVILFIDAAYQRLYEAAYTYESDGYLAREVSTVNEHLFLPGIDRVTYMDDPHKIIWNLRRDGKLVAFGYDREQRVAGGCTVDVQGFVEDILAMPGRQNYDLWLLVRREVNGQTKRYVERLAPFWRKAVHEGESPVYAACAFQYDDPDNPASVVSGLGALEGYTLGVWANGRDIGDAEVVGGSLTLPMDLSAEHIVVGIRMPWRLETLRVPTFGNRDGAGLGRRVRVVDVRVDFFESAGVRGGSLAGVDDFVWSDEIEDDPDSPTPLRTGSVVLTADDSFGNGGVVVLEGDKMHPVTVRGVMIGVDGEP